MTDSERYLDCLTSSVPYSKVYNVFKEPTGTFTVGFVEPSKAEVDNLLVTLDSIAREDISALRKKRKATDHILAVYIRSLAFGSLSYTGKPHLESTNGYVRFSFLPETAYNILIEYLESFKKHLGELQEEHFPARNILESFVMRHTSTGLLKNKRV